MSVAGAALLCATAVPGAPAAADGNGPVVIDVTQPQRSLYPIAIPMAVDSDAATATTVAEVAAFDLGVAGWFKVLDARSFLADLSAEGLSIDPKKWKEVGAYGVIKYRALSSGRRLILKFMLYEVEKGARPVLEKSYTGTSEDVRKLSHQWCNEVVKYYTGEPGFFGSKIAFVGKGAHDTKQIRAMDFDGHGVHDLTRNRSINILPSWSPSGGDVAFTSYMRANPDLYIVGAGAVFKVRTLAQGVQGRAK
jgi:TolB protein